MTRSLLLQAHERECTEKETHRKITGDQILNRWSSAFFVLFQELQEQNNSVEDWAFIHMSWRDYSICSWNTKGKIYLKNKPSYWFTVERVTVVLTASLLQQKPVQNTLQKALQKTMFEAKVIITRLCTPWSLVQWLLCLVIDEEGRLFTKLFTRM